MATQANYTVPTISGNNYLRVGSSGDTVKQLQESLNAVGYDVGGVDGIFGSKTANALRNFQKSSGIDIDAIYGQQSAAALQGAIAKLQAQTATPTTDTTSTTPDAAITGALPADSTGQVNSNGFVYDPETDPAFQAAMAQQERQIVEEMSRRGILGSSVEQERLVQAGMQTAGQFQQAAYERFTSDRNFQLQQEQVRYDMARQERLDSINEEQRKIENAWDKVQFDGYVSNENARILGIPAGTRASAAGTTVAPTSSNAYLTMQNSVSSWFANDPAGTIEDLLRAALSGEITPEEAEDLVNGIKVQTSDYNMGDLKNPRQWLALAKEKYLRLTPQQLEQFLAGKSLDIILGYDTTGTRNPRITIDPKMKNTAQTE
jgi:peptidoglycan hydrolase-like protein with peptidoglycan-binding domain